jgi:hypothetical protein
MKAAYGTVYISICIHWALSSDECVPFWVSDEWVSLSGSPFWVPLSGSPFLGPSGSLGQVMSGCPFLGPFLGHPFLGPALRKRGCALDPLACAAC